MTPDGMVVVERGSDAWKELQQAFDDPAARKETTS